MTTVDQITPFTPLARMLRPEKKKENACDEHAKTQRRPSKDHIVDESAKVMNDEYRSYNNLFFSHRHGNFHDVDYSMDRHTPNTQTHACVRDSVGTNGDRIDEGRTQFTLIDRRIDALFDQLDRMNMRQTRLDSLAGESRF